MMKGTQPPRLRPFVLLAVVRDLDPGRFGFGTLRDRYFEHAVLVRGLDRVTTDIGGKPESPMDSAVVAVRAVNPRVFCPCGLAAPGVDHHRPRPDPHLERGA